MNDLPVTDIPNDLNLSLKALQRPQFNQTYALAMVDFGSIDSMNIPAGAAHFLEHKLFAKPTYDSSQMYAKYGADSNAFTSYTKTAYLFKTVGKVENNLLVLLDLLSNPYFTAENVQKEREIITQEIQMYSDMPEWAIEQTTLRNLYPTDPLGDDIAGTASSIAQITPQTLMEIYQTYYTPKNISLYLAGNIDVDKISQTLNQALQDDVNLQNFAARTNAPVVRQKPNWQPVIAQEKITFKAQRPRLMMGLRIDTKDTSPADMIVLQNKLELLLELILGETSTQRKKWSDDGIIDDSFGYTVIIERQYAFILISAETQANEELAQLLQEYLLGNNFSAELVAEKFQAAKRDSLGNYLLAEDYMENLATEAAELSFYNLEYQQMFNLIAQIELTDLSSLAHDIFKSENLTITYLEPKK